MTATDELRKLLDERGVKWKAYDVRLTCQTWWTGAHGILWNATEVNGTGRNALNIKTANLDVTSAQAIEATLGRGTCRAVKVNRLADDNDPYDICACSECGAYLDPMWHYCGICGRKVVDE